MSYNYEDSSLENSENLISLESELARLREETSNLYKNEYVIDFIENYHIENKQIKENIDNSKLKSTTRLINNLNNSKSKKFEPYSYDVDIENDKNISILKSHKKKEKKSNFKSKNTDKINKNGLPIFSRKYELQDDSKRRFMTINIDEVRGDLIRSPNKNKNEVIKKINTRKKNRDSNIRDRDKLNIKNEELDFIYDNQNLSNSDFSDNSENSYINELKKGHNYKKGDEKILYYLDSFSEEDHENNNELNREKVNEEENRLEISNTFLSNLPSNTQINANNNQDLDKNERDFLIKKIQSLEVVESSQKMLILEAQNKEQQYRIRCEELQKQLEYKETKLLLLNQDYEMLKRDYNLQNEEKEMIKKKYSEMETRWNEEYSTLYKYKIDYEMISKQNEILLTEKNSFITLIENDKERYRKMEINNTSLLLNVDNLEKRNHEIVQRCTKLQEDNDSLSREYNKLYQKYTSLLSEYGSTKKIEENLNSKIVELEDQNKKLTNDNNFINEKYKTLSATERALEQAQESNINLSNEITSIKEERDILSTDNKNLEKKIKSSDETIYELKNQILDYTLENQKLKKLIKQTILPLIPDYEYNSTISHILTVLNAKENSRMSIKVLEEEYLNNSKKKNKNDQNTEAINIWKDIESPFSPKKNSNNDNSSNLNLINQNLTKLSHSSPLSEKLSPKTNKSKNKNINTNLVASPKTKFASNIKKFEKIAPVKHNINELNTKSLIINNDDNLKQVAITPYKSCPELTHDQIDTENVENKNEEELFPKGLSILTPRPSINKEELHTIPTILPKKLEINIKKSLENEENIPVIPIDDDHEKIPIENELNNELQTKHHDNNIEIEGESCAHINDCVRMIDNYEKQILLLNVEKVQLEAELSTLPTDNWAKNAKEKESRDYIERRLSEIKNSITKASSNIRAMKENKKFKDEVAIK